MRIVESARRSAVGITPERTIGQAAEIMESSNVGALVVLDGERLVGIVTDRDIVRRGLARHVPADARIDAIMTSDVVTIDAEADVRDAYTVFRTHPIRRLPVTDHGRFVAMVTIDDLMMDLASDLSDLARPVTAEVLFGHRDAPTPVVVLS